MNVIVKSVTFSLEPPEIGVSCCDLCGAIVPPARHVMHEQYHVELGAWLRALRDGKVDNGELT